MRAALVTDKQTVAIRQMDRPALRDNEVMIEVRTAGICGSDLHLFMGTHAFRKPPAVLGHEVAGDIVEVGSKVTRFRVGDRVTVEPHEGCGSCEFCKQGLVNICKNKIAPGTPKWIGTFVEYFNAPEDYVYKLADSVSYEMGTMIEPLAVAVHAMNRITVKERASLVILGAGTIGLLMLTVAREMGYRQIICTDTAPFNREMALRHGAALALDPITEDVAAVVKEYTGGVGADVAMVAAGAPNILDQASGCVRRRGEIGLVAMITEKIPFYCYSMVFNEQTMFGAMTYSTPHFKKAAEMVNGGLDLADYITQRVDLEHTQQGLDMLSQKKENVVKIMVTVS